MLQEKWDRFAIRAKDVTNAYLQSDATECLINKLSLEGKKDASVAWEVIRQLYGEVEADRYWRSTFAL